MPHMQIKPYFNTTIPPHWWDFLSIQNKKKLVFWQQNTTIMTIQANSTLTNGNKTQQTTEQIKIKNHNNHLTEKHLFTFVS